MPTKAQRRRWKRTTYQNIKSDPTKYAKHRAQSARTAQVLRKWIADYKVERGCEDCGYNEHFAALQFDHEGPKTAAISEIRTSRARIMAEIENGQCKVRCANCHAIKTWERKQAST